MCVTSWDMPLCSMMIICGHALGDFGVHRELFDHFGLHLIGCWVPVCIRISFCVLVYTLVNMLVGCVGRCVSGLSDGPYECNLDMLPEIGHLIHSDLIGLGRSSPSLLPL